MIVSTMTCRVFMSQKGKHHLITEWFDLTNKTHEILGELEQISTSTVHLKLYRNTESVVKHFLLKMRHNLISERTTNLEWDIHTLPLQLLGCRHKQIEIVVFE